MKVINTAIIRLTLILLGGILAGFKFSIEPDLLIPAILGAFFFFAFSFFRARRQLLQDPLFGISCLLLFFFLGFAIAQLHQPVNQRSHYSNKPYSEKSVLRVSISEKLRSSLYQDKFIVEVKSVDERSTFGKLLLLLPKDTHDLQVDDLVLIASPLKPIPKTLNPQQFNYREFMANRGILFQTSPKTPEIHPLAEQQPTYKGTIGEIHSKIDRKLRQHQFEEKELAVVQALWLGQRRDIPSETYDNFVAAGVVHILAVSGLHVGLILLILHSLFSPLDRFRHGKVVKIILLLLCLWSYAFLAGLSPSVVRAVSMFSFLAVGMQLKRRTSVVNTLFLSLMLLILVRPQWVFEVGFQLSYLAVLSIVILQPQLSALYIPRTGFMRYLWNLLTVTSAAQIGVMPLSLFYFHQFPGLFFLSNLLILPFLGILLGLGILVMFLALLNKLPAFLADIFRGSVELLNDVVEWVANQESFFFQDIPFSLLQVFAFYSLLLLFLFTANLRAVQRIKLLLLGLICLQGVYIYEAFTERTRELVIFHNSRHSIIAEKENRLIKISHNLGTPPEEQFFIKNYRLINKNAALQTTGLKNLYVQDDKVLLVIDSSSVYRIPGLLPEKILLINSPELNLERLIWEFELTEIIADGSNYPSFVKKMEGDLPETQNSISLYR